MRALFHYSSVMADRGKPRNITIFSSASPLLITSLKLSENFWSWGLDNKMACWYHQDCLNSLRAECNIRASKEGRELICNCQKCSKTQNPEPFCFVINCLSISFLTGYCEGDNTSSLLSPHSLSQIWTRDPGNDSVRKKHITGKYTPRTGHEPATCFPFLPGIRDSGFWTLQFRGNCFTRWLWFHPQQCLAGVWRATGQSWLSITEPRDKVELHNIHAIHSPLNHQIGMPEADRAFITPFILVQLPFYWENFTHVNMDLCFTIKKLEPDLSLRSFPSPVFAWW